MAENPFYSMYSLKPYRTQSRLRTMDIKYNAINIPILRESKQRMTKKQTDTRKNVEREVPY